jgi:cytoskeletal protein RodZ
MNDEIVTEESNKCSGNVQEVASREELLHELAQCLKSTRKGKNLKLEEIALTLKLRTSYLESLESADWSAMPGEVYAIGFLKQYAAFLDLDISDSIEKLKTGQYKLTKPLTFPDPPIAPNKTWVIVAALLFVVALIVFNLFNDSGEPQRTVLVPETVENSMDTEITLENEIMQESSTAIPALIESQPETFESASTTTEEATVEHRYTLTAVGGDAWLQVSAEEVAGEAPVMLREALLHDGESTTIRHSSASLLLTCGNAVALQVHIDGKLVIAAGSLGESGKVLRDFKLTTE